MRYLLSVDTDQCFCNVPTCVILIVTSNEGESVSVHHFHYFEFFL